MQFPSPPTPLSQRTPLKIQRAVLVALVIRDLRTRVQGQWLGLLWMLFEPLAHVLLILALFGFRPHAVSATVELPVFLVTGVLPFFIFRNLARRLPNAVSSNMGLFAYRQVKPVDAMLSRAIVETGLYCGVYVAALMLLGWLGYRWVPHAPLELLMVITMVVALGIGFGLCFAVLAHNRPKVDAVIGILFFPLYLLSGVLFPLHALAPEYRQVLMWNPVVHLVDLSRTHFVPNYQPLPDVSLPYAAACTLVVGALGMSLYRLYRHRLAVQD